MPTVLDDVIERHSGAEPRVLTEDVQRILREKIRPDEEGVGVPVAAIAEAARVSTRTVYRVVNPGESKETISLDTADRLCLACGAHLLQCRLVWDNGEHTDYGHLTVQED